MLPNGSAVYEPLKTRSIEYVEQNDQGDKTEGHAFQNDMVTVGITKNGEAQSKYCKFR